MSKYMFLTNGAKMSFCELDEDLQKPPQVLETLGLNLSIDEAQSIVDEYVPGGRISDPNMFRVYAPELTPEIIEAALFTVEDDRLYDFVVDEYGMYTGYGHQNKEEFAAEIIDYEIHQEVNSPATITADDIKHKYIRPFDPSEDGIFQECEATSWNAIPVTTMWDYPW